MHKGNHQPPDQGIECVPTAKGAEPTIRAVDLRSDHQPPDQGIECVPTAKGAEPTIRVEPFSATALIMGSAPLAVGTHSMPWSGGW
ncbi:unnamed protein product [Prunus armeniaca]